MADLITTYSRNTGLEIGKPFIYEAFFPRPAEKYICIHPSSGNTAKNYSYWQDVIDIIHPILAANNISIVQLGGGEDAPLNRCIHLQGKTNIHQTAYIIKNSLLLACNDSMLSHIAGNYEIPLLTLFGPTSPQNHGAHFRNEKKTIFLESHRNNKNPSFQYAENPRTIDLIKIEDVCNNLLKLLDLQLDRNFETINIGSRYTEAIIEAVPDGVIAPDFFPNSIINIRADYEFNPSCIYEQIYVRRCSVYTNKPLDVNILKQLKNNITAIIYEIEETDYPQFVNDIRLAGINIGLVSKLDNETLNKKKLNYLDAGVIFPAIYQKKENIPSNDLITSETYFRTRKILLSQGKFYLSNAHRLMGISQKDFFDNEGKVLDFPKFYEESDFFWFFNKK